MKKLSLFLAATLALSACGEAENKDVVADNVKPIVKIGSTLPLTGDLAYAGEKIQKALILSLEDIKAKKDLKYDYQLVFEDDTFELKKAIQNLNRFNDIHKIRAVLTLWGGIGTLTSNFANQKEMIHMGCALSDVVGQGYYNFNHATTPQEHASNLIRYYKKNGYKRIGLFYAQTSECVEFAQILQKMLHESGLEVVFDISVNPNARDVKAEIQKMKSAAPEAVFVEIVSPLLEIFGKQIRENGFNAPLTNLNTFPSAPTLYEGQIYLTEKSGNDNFVKHYTEKTGLTPMPCVANLYDGLQMIIEGFENTTSTNGEIPSNKDVVQTMLDNKNFQGVIPVLGIDKEGNINSESVIMKIVNGTPQEIK